MIRLWVSRQFAAHRSAWATALGGTLVLALVVTTAVVSGGYTAQRLDLGDAAVWVTNEARQAVGRANTAVMELNTVVTSESSNLDVLQSGATVLVLDTGNSSLDILDPATATIVRSVALPPRAPAVFLAGTRTLIASNGEVWETPTSRLASFDTATAPTLSLGAGSVVSVDDTGTLVSFTPATGALAQAPSGSGTVTSSQTLSAGSPGDDYQLTSVNGAWALLNATSRHLFLDGRDVDLSGLIVDGGAPALQQPSLSGSRVLIAHEQGLVAVPLSGGAPTVLVSGRNGTAAAPDTAGQCAYAAWSDGTAWRDCGDAGSGGSASGASGGSRGTQSGTTTTLTGLNDNARLAFRRNGTGLVLNDAHNGSTWAVQRDNQLIDNWADLIDTTPDTQRIETNGDDTPPVYDKVQAPPVAVDDSFGARPGRIVTLPVLLNDSDPNGDVLVIESVTPIDATDGRLDLVGNNQQVQLTVAEAATGQLRFGYTINDGRGGSASATVTVTLRAPGENSAPQQVRTTHATVRAGGRVTSQVLGDWIDPDGDPVYLASASAAGPDLLSFTPAGAVVFTDAGTNADDKRVGLSVSDGRLLGTGSLTVSVRASGAVPIVADSFIVLATAGAEVSVSPLDHARGGSAPLRLSSVPAKPDATITPDFASGAFRFLSSTPGVHEIEYSVTDGQLTATGRVRVDVAPAADANSTPVTVPHTAFIRGQQATLVDVLASDFDPANGVLLITGTMNVPASSGMRIEILDQRILRVTLTRPLPDGGLSFGYRISNGLADAEGTVTVVEIPALGQKQAPIAVADTATVRVGDTIDIPVLANDEQPDGDSLTLDPVLASGLPPGAGLLFAAGTVLRYLAPATPGTYTAVYRVNAPDGQYANAEVRISVREADPSTNNPPVPKTVTARVLSGGTVEVSIPLTGIDPDGDSVQLVGQETNPEKGSVTADGTDTFRYQAGEYSAGTDTFSYAVVDALGARAIGTVRIGISPRLDGARNPVAAPDDVVVRPGSTVSVHVLANDSDPDGGRLTISAVEPSGTPADLAADHGTAMIAGDTIAVTAPATPGRFGFIYEISNERGGTSSTFLTVVVRADAPRARPEARDTHLTLSDVLAGGTVDVDVLANVTFADGPARGLALSVPESWADSARVTDAKRVRVTVHATSQIIPFQVANPDDASITALAFIWVPGYTDALPQLRKGVPALTVASGANLTIPINDYVVAVGGKQVRLTDRSLVHATRSNGADLATSDTSIAFTSADQYYGPASVSFVVTDGTGAGDPDGHTATIVLPITVTPQANQPPAFDGAVLDFEPDQTKVIDLSKLTSYPYPNDQASLVYSVLDPKPVGFDYSLDGQQLTLHARTTTLPASGGQGGHGSITIGVSAGGTPGRAGRIEMSVVASTRPLAIPAADVAIAPRGQTTVVDVLANDGAANPFPQVPLRVVAVRGLGGAGIPAGVRITPSADNSTLSVQVAANAAAADTNLEYEVADATNDPNRYAWGTVRISVQDRPDPVTSLSVTGFSDTRLAVAFNPGAANNSAVTGYEITLVNAVTGAAISTTTCQATSCTVPTGGNGRANAVRVSVAARNGLGLGATTALADTVWSDVVPSAPGNLAAAPLNGGLTISWAPVPNGAGSPITDYLVTVNGTAQPAVNATGPGCGATRCSLTVNGLANGAFVPVSVSARNESYPALSAWTSASTQGTPYGAPTAGAVSASAGAAGTVHVAWDAFSGSGDPVGGYFVQRLTNGTVPTGNQACTVTSPAPGTVVVPHTGANVAELRNLGAGATSVDFTGLTSDTASYSFVVWAYNRAGCTNSQVTTVQVQSTPGAVTDPGASMGMHDTAYDLQITPVSPGAGVTGYEVRAVDAATGTPGASATFTATALPRQLLTPTVFGAPFSYQVRACDTSATWGTCGAWSATMTAPAASVSLAVTGLAYDPATGVFGWTNGPDNGAYTTGYSCSVPTDPGTAPVAGGPTSCTLAAPAAAGTARLAVSVDLGLGTGNPVYNYDR
ncbi:fibronectin type III domain-containing protein [Cryobacterium sp. MDB1-18-2]|uniref:Ig-like domain-containing protein n=1 Tax=unclassified Cryobacterium TaxID=2649013 RepID=UPI00106A84AC|nr:MULTISPECIES: Ig-like domain-containing protein [unclassified Cryobacterium]TFC27706.1 fibronectin type III domain-containing protein [Cryobacterium sp. MDB1-18-2]TFC39180.1 fibronectin type III domain-containing protein [Cryobacterium sp. MDB1-18-1]